MMFCSLLVVCILELKAPFASAVFGVLLCGGLRIPIAHWHRFYQDRIQIDQDRLDNKSRTRPNKQSHETNNLAPAPRAAPPCSEEDPQSPEAANNANFKRTVTGTPQPVEQKVPRRKAAGHTCMIYKYRKALALGPMTNACAARLLAFHFESLDLNANITRVFLRCRKWFAAPWGFICPDWPRTLHLATGNSHRLVSCGIRIATPDSTRKTRKMILCRGYIIIDCRTLLCFAPMRAKVRQFGYGPFRTERKQSITTLWFTFKRCCERCLTFFAAWKQSEHADIKCFTQLWSLEFGFCCGCLGFWLATSRKMTPVQCLINKGIALSQVVGCNAKHEWMRLRCFICR